MRTASRIRVIAWGTVLLVVLSVLISGLRSGWGWGNFSFFGSGNQYANSDQYTAGNGEIAASQVDHIKVYWTSGSVEVKETSSDKIIFSEENNNLDDKEKLHYYLEGNTLHIQFSSAKKWFSWGKNKNKNLILEIPKGKEFSSAKIDVVSASTNIDVLKGKDVQIENVSGGIYLNEITADTLDIDTVSGGVEGNKITAKEVKSNAVSGKTTLKGKIEKLRVETVSGGIDLTPGAKVREIRTESVSGGVNIHLPENEGFTADFDKVSGSFSSDFETSGKKDTYTYKNGAIKIDAEAVSGGLHIYKVA